MGGPVFDGDKCIGCGMCASDCGLIILEKKGNGNVPYLFFPEFCIQCGHCIAICQKDAISHPEMSMDHFKLIGQLPDPNDVQLLLESMRSVRQFKNKPVDKETIKRLIRTASMAPSDLNSQHRSFCVITDQEKLDHLEFNIVDGFKRYVEGSIKSGKPKDSVEFFLCQNIVDEYTNGRAPIFKNAPCVIIIYGPRIENEIFAPLTAFAANSYLMLLAHSLGLGSCIIGRALYDRISLQNHLNISNDNQIYTVITLGHPKIKYRKTVDRKPAEVLWI
jgi:nitroreductase/Pyruvate/2-oxoacid:ferredoxin oxidoreductase delta subunit